MSEQRKVVTVLFADVVGSTELAAQRDPEVVRSIMSSYFKRVGEIAVAYGGTVEKFAGDAAMVVFGVPAAHDDDAERAVRAALEIRDGATDAAVRVGVNTGEAVTAMTDDRQFMVSGDTVNVAARLQQGADAGEVIVGALTHQLTRGVIEYAPHEPVSAKGKSEALVAFRAVRALSAVPVQQRGVPGLHAELVGRDRELRLLLDTFARTSEHNTVHLFTISGAAGIGKSRLVNEALERLAAEGGARVMRGRCLPYGRGVTFWPFIEMLRQETGIGLVDERRAALAKLDRWLGELMPDNAQRPAIHARLAVMLGLDTVDALMADTPPARVDAEIVWAVRHCLESVARTTSLIAVIDDIQWGAPPVLALVEQLADRAPEVPMLIVCVARPEFLESHPGWSSGKANATTLTLDPLNPEQTKTLVSRLLEVEAIPGDLRQQIVDRSSGTPLFCEEFIQMLIDEKVVVRDGDRWQATTGVDQIRVPQGINAVLTARLDLLSDAERDTLQAASVVGERFGQTQVAALVPGSDVLPLLESLRRKGLIAGGDGDREEFRFKHLLIRDAAYGSLPKARRADLHDRFREVLEESADPLQLAEILAHHADRAFTLSRELRLDDNLVQERARHAVRWMFTLAERARMRYESGTLEAALKSLREAAELLPAGVDAATRARIRLLEAQLLVMKADYALARQAAAEAAAMGDEAGLPSIVATAHIAEAWILNWSLEGSLDEFQVAVERAIDASRRAGDEQAEIEARHIGTNRLWASGDIRGYVAVNEELVRRAKAIGDVAHAAAITARLVPARFFYGDPDESLRLLEEAEELAARHGFRNVALRTRFDRAMRELHVGDPSAAERMWRDFGRAAVEAGDRISEISALRFLGLSLLSWNRPAEAAEVLDEGLQLSRETGERWNRTELLALRAGAARATGDLPAADAFMNQALQSLRREDLTAHAETYTELGAIRAAQGRDREAEATLRDALDTIAGTDYDQIKIIAGLGLAEFLADRGRSEEAAQLAETFGELAHTHGWKRFDGQLARIAELLETRARPT